MKRARISKPPITRPADVTLREGDVNAFPTISVSGQSNVNATSSTTILTLIAGNGVAITTNDTTKGVTISAEAWPVGSIFLSVVSTNPATLLGYGTWSAFAAGRVLIGDNGGTFPAGATGGATTVAAAGSNSAPTISGSVAAEAAHTHSVTSNVTVADHAAHTHSVTSNVTVADHADHTHTITQTAFASTKFVSAAGTTNAYISGGVCNGSTGNPSATQTHTVTNNAVTSGNPSATQTHTPTNNAVTSASGSSHLHAAGTLAASAPTFTGSATSVLQPYIVCYMWQRTA